MSTPLEIQCIEVGWPLEQITASRRGKKLWTLGDVIDAPPEAAATFAILKSAQACSWCEGGSMNLMMKCAALDTLAKLNTFEDRTDAVRRFLEAQLTILQEHRADIIHEIRSVTDTRFYHHVDEVLADDFIRDAYPRVRADFICRLWRTVGRDFVVRLASVFASKPYEYRSGWPDLTAIVSGGVQFIEVKTTDLLHESQLRFAREVATPLGLRCRVLQLIATPQQVQ